MSGQSEAWNSRLYFAVAMPAWFVVSAVIGYAWPGAPWAAAAGIWLGQSVAMFSRGLGIIWPISLAIMAAFCLPFVAGGYLGYYISRK